MLLTMISFAGFLLIQCAGDLSPTKPIDADAPSGENFVVIPFDAERHKWIFKDSKPVSINKSDIADVQELVKKSIDENNNKAKSDRQKIDLTKYKFQYIPATRENGDKEVWVNGFCKAFDDRWKKEIISVDDGGKCFFNLYINLTAKKYRDLQINGEA